MSKKEAELNLKMYDTTNEKVTIIVVHKDRPDYLNMCLQSIAALSSKNNYDIIVVDDCSKEPESADFLEELETQKVKLVRNTETKYWSKSVNEAIRIADVDSKYFLLLHHDVIVLSKGWLDLLVNVAETQNCGLVGQNMSFYELDDMNGKAIPVEFVQEWCMLVSRACYDACGPFHEDLPQIGPAFIFTLTAQYQGFNPQVIANPIVHHYEETSLDQNTYKKLEDDALILIPKLIREKQKQLQI